MKYFFTIFCCVASLQLFSQNNLIGIDQQHKDIGAQENIYKVKADYVVQNNLSKNLYLMRADAQKGITIWTSKKTIRPKDTAIIVIEFIPKQTGKFTETISLVTSADGEPFKISLAGNIKSIKTDDKTACFYFGKPNNQGVKTTTEPIVVTAPATQRDNSNKIPDNNSTPTNTVTETKQPEIKEPVVTKNEALLDENLYKPNNIVFLVDVSSSMKDSSKLPVMQHALHYLIDALRPSDKITFITYADSVKLIRDGISGNQKQDLNEVVDKLKARGLTKGNKAILYSLDVALKNYLAAGNNQIILATDGKFRFYSEDQQKYITKQGDKQILLSTVAFGNDKDAMGNLKDIARIGKGNFIHIKNNAKAKDQLLNEIRQNSLIQR